MAAQKRARRERGSGSIYQTKDGSWIAQARIEGRLIRRRAPDEQAAKAQLKTLLTLRAQQIDIYSGAQSVTTWMNTYHEQKCQQRDPKPRTIEFNRDMIERYILPDLGAMRLLDVRPTHIQACINGIRSDIRSAGMHDGVRTVRAAAAILKEALTLAFDRKLIPDNPYSGIVLPRYRRKPIAPLDDMQVRALLTVARDHRLASLWACYALLGLRRGEGLGLRWSSFDRARRTITIDQQVQRVGGGAILIGTPKTEESTRELPIPTRLYAWLCERWDDAQAERVLRDIAWHEHGLIFPSQVGTPIWPDNLESTFRRLRVAAHLPATVKLHHLRHTLATLLDECGATEALKAGILGHSKQTQTQKYTHARLEAMRRALQAVEDRLFGAEELSEQTGT